MLFNQEFSKRRKNLNYFYNNKTLLKLNNDIFLIQAHL